VLLVLGFILFAGIPLMALVALRSSYRWMARRTKKTS